MHVCYGHENFEPNLKSKNSDRVVHFLQILGDLKLDKHRIKVFNILQVT